MASKHKKEPNLILFSFKFIYFIILFNLFIVSVCVGSPLLRAGLSLVVVSGGFSLQWLLLLWSTGSRRAGFSSCGVWAQ